MAQWNPLHDLVTLQDRMNQLFEDASHRRTSEAESGDELEQADWYPAADVFENDSEFIVSVDLPGINRPTLDIGLDDNRLVIRGKRATQDTNQHRRECPSGNFLRTFTVPASVDQTRIKADYKDGVLQIHLPKGKEQKARRIEIKVS
jgi:HSP20 family protein